MAKFIVQCNRMEEAKDLWWECDTERQALTHHACLFPECLNDSWWDKNVINLDERPDMLRFWKHHGATLVLGPYNHLW